MHKPRTKITEIPVANERLYNEVARLTKQDKRAVQQQVEFIGEFVAGVIRDGTMQGIMIPYFGKFQPKISELRTIKEKESIASRGLNDVVKALKGKSMEPSEITLAYRRQYPKAGKADDDQPQTDTNETI